MKNWLFLAVAIVAEVAVTSAFKSSDGLTKLGRIAHRWASGNGAKHLSGIGPIAAPIWVKQSCGQDLD